LQPLLAVADKTPGWRSDYGSKNAATIFRPAKIQITAARAI
jgi:hypothetical protein